MSTNLFSAPSQKKGQSINPFARALANNAELEQNLGKNKPAGQDGSSDFSRALANAGGKLPDGFGANQLTQEQQQEAAAKQAEQLKKERLHKKLHEQVNPVDMVDVYNAREKRVKEEIDQVRHELKLLAHDIAKFQQQVDITLMTEVVDPGQDGKYYVSFFQKLRAWIQLLRQQIKSAQTWATQLHSKNSKKRKHSKQPGLEFGAAQHEKTSTVQDMISNSERNTVYSGG